MSPSPSTAPSPSAASPAVGEQIRRDLADVEQRFAYHAPTTDQQHLLGTARSLLRDAAEFLVINLAPSRERSLALTALEDAAMRVNRAIVFDKAPS